MKSTRTSVTPHFTPVSSMFSKRYAILWIKEITHATDGMTAKNDKLSILGHLGQKPPGA
jgi:hypothetical protein